jgi:S1-C subfamily serine protease
MVNKEKIADCYANARFFIKQDNPKDARAYVLALLNIGIELYRQQTAILQKAQTQAFLEKWVAVSQDLYDIGITDFVRTCFGLPTRQGTTIPKVEPKSNAGSKPAAPLELTGGEINLEGLIDEISQTQGWCAALFEKCKRGVVQIRVSSQLQGASGTGFIISQNGYLLTNDHIVYDKECNSYYPKIFMSFSGEKKTYKISVVDSRTRKKGDVALCRFEPSEVPGFISLPLIKHYDTLMPGADCAVIGNAFNFGLAPFSGTVRYLKDSSGDLVHTSLSHNGDSGGPVLNRSGEVIGIHKSNTESVNEVRVNGGFANATPADRIRELLDEWIKAHGITL